MRLVLQGKGSTDLGNSVTKQNRKILPEMLEKNPKSVIIAKLFHPETTLEMDRVPADNKNKFFSMRRSQEWLAAAMTIMMDFK